MNNQFSCTSAVLPQEIPSKFSQLMQPERSSRVPCNVRCIQVDGVPRTPNVGDYFNLHVPSSADKVDSAAFIDRNSPLHWRLAGAVVCIHGGLLITELQYQSEKPTGRNP
jgi:hypothetical protein